MKKRYIRKCGILFLVLGILSGCGGSGKTYPSEYEVSAHPKISELKQVQSNEQEQISDSLGIVNMDMGNSAQGVLLATLKKDPGKRIKISITKENSEDAYYYDLTKLEKVESLPFSLGSGTYLIKVLMNDEADMYSIIYSDSIDVQLENEQIPFLYPNQIVDYDENSKAIQKAFALCKNQDTALDRIATLYNYVVDNITYDKAKAKEVDDIYVLPIIDETLSTKKGICFDYAALLTAMLRSQQIPTRLVTGNTSIEYHAWVEVYLADKGWISAEILLKSKKWSRMDPTFEASGANYEDGYENKYYY